MLTAIETGTEKELGKYPSVDWVSKAGDISPNNTDPARDCFWEVCSLDKIQELVLSHPDSPKDVIEAGQFADDRHHLSEVGHRELANGLAHFLPDKHDQIFLEKSLGLRGIGDQCYDWFVPGQIPLPYTEGGGMNNLTKTGTDVEWVLEIDPVNGGTIEIRQ